MKPVRMRWSGIALALGMALCLTTGAEAGQRKSKSKPTVKKAKAWTGAENALVGIKLYDTGLRVLDVYGTPDDIQALSFSGTTGGAGGGAGGGAPGGPMGPMGPMGPGMGGPPGGMGAPRGSGGPTGGAPRGFPGGAGRGKGSDVIGPVTDISGSFDFGDTMLMQGKAGGGAGMTAGLDPSFGGGGGGQGGPPGGMPGGAGRGGGAPAMGGGAQDRVTFTRWVYNRQGSKYAFIIDKVGHVVQIEAIGIDNNRVKTKRGIGFGATFAQVMKSYQQPDGYEIGGDNLMVKYLVHDNVAFRLSRLGTKKPQVVTGIVVAAGKS